MLRSAIISLISTVAISFSAGAQGVLSLSQSLTDQTVVLPASFEADTHRMLQNWYLKNYTVLDAGIDFTTDVPTTDAVIIDRLSKMPVNIEMPFNSVVRSVINAYTQRRRGLVQNMLGLGIYYNPIFEEALEREGLPMELKYLPVIESALNPDAVSPVGAAGLWQFMPGTAKNLGMEVNTVVDERRDPVKSSRMGAKYLKQLYEIFGDWSLAIAAYNCGPGNVNKAIRRAGGGRKDFWSIYPYLPAETRGYVPAFIAANYVMNYHKEHGIKPAVARRPIVTDSVHVKKRVYFQQIADVLNIPVDEIKILNPQYRQGYIPGDIRPYPLVLPSYQIYSYIMSEDSIVARDAAKYARRAVVEPSDGRRVQDSDGYIVTETVKYHKVKRGDTFTSLAKKYGTTATKIKKDNKIKSLKRGTTIKIVTTKRVPKPVEETSEENDTVAAAAAAAVAEVNTHPGATAQVDEEADATEEEVAEEVTLAKNDTKATTADKKKGTDKAADKTDKQKAADKKKDKNAKDKASKPVYHTVKKGESPYKIAQKYNTTVDKILKLNGLKKNSKIQPGDKIRVK